MKSFCFAVFFVCSIATAGVVQPLTSAPQLLIPAAGSTPGANGTFFRSNIAIVNLASHDQIVQLRWLPQGGSSNATTTVTIDSSNNTLQGLATALNASGGDVRAAVINDGSATPDMGAHQSGASAMTFGVNAHR